MPPAKSLTNAQKEQAMSASKSKIKVPKADGHSMEINPENLVWHYSCVYVVDEDGQPCRLSKLERQ